MQDETASHERMFVKCIYCSKCRNESGYWEQLSVTEILAKKEYISHGTCPKCFRKHFPEEFSSLQKEGLITFSRKVLPDNQIVYEIYHKIDNKWHLSGRYRGEQ